MGKFNSKVEQLESRTVSWNGLCSKFEVPLYFEVLLDCEAAWSLSAKTVYYAIEILIIKIERI
jgi:hypothetical protein